MALCNGGDDGAGTSPVLRSPKAKRFHAAEPEEQLESVDNAAAASANVWVGPLGAGLPQALLENVLGGCHGAGGTTDKVGVDSSLAVVLNSLALAVNNMQAVQTQQLGILGGLQSGGAFGGIACGLPAAPAAGLPEAVRAWAPLLRSLPLQRAVVSSMCRHPRRSSRRKVSVVG